MSQPTIAEALAETLSEMEAMSPEELRVELDKHKAGSLAIALGESAEFLKDYHEKIQHDGTPGLL